MTLNLITPPVGAIIGLEEMRLHLRVDATDGTSPDDPLILSLIEAATDELDGRDGWLGRALLTQTWELTLDEFSDWQTPLPLPPLQSVTHIKYIDADGALQTLSSSLYRVLTTQEPGIVEPVYGGSWSSARAEVGAVRITYVCGYGAAAASVPAMIRLYAKQMIRAIYDGSPMPDSGMLSTYRKWVL